MRRLIKDKSTALPVHVAIIPDGNGRWASGRKLPRSMGHSKGGDRIRELVKNCSSIGIRYLTIYTFSTENWKRPANEIDFLMEMLSKFLANIEKEIKGSDVRIRIIGNRSGLSEYLQQQIVHAEQYTSANNGLTLIFAINYGARDEIISAVKRAAYDVKSGAVAPDALNEELFGKYLYTAGIPEPDLLIRTGAEKRISNFLLWQMAYTELVFTDTLWPDFRKEDLIDSLTEFAARKRRFGGV